MDLRTALNECAGTILTLMFSYLFFQCLGYYLQDHVMRCENSATRYETCPSTGRLSLVLPLEAMNPTGKKILKMLIFATIKQCFVSVE